MRNELKYNGKTYTDDSDASNKLISASVFLSDSFTADTLAADTMSVKVQDLDNEARILTFDGYPIVDKDGYLLVAPRLKETLDKFYKYGDELIMRHDGSIIGGKFRIEEIKRIATSQYSISAISDVGLLLTEKHYGGLYTGQPVSEVVNDIVAGAFEYTLDPIFATYPVYGLLRVDQRRNNLRNLLFAMGGQIRKDENGNVIICAMPDPIPYPIDADHIYMGGSVTNGKPATGIDLTEHNFVATENDITVTLFDGVASAVELVTPKGKALTGVLIVFKEPVHDLIVSNSEILESDVNYAVIAGSPAAVLTGRQYTHTTRIVSRRIASNAKPNVIPSTACELVNQLNAELVADRLVSYYGAAKTISADIVLTNQKTGDAVSFTDPFGDPAAGYLSEMNLTISATVKAKATVISGFIPTGSGNYYRNVLVITQSGSVTIPAEAKEKGLLVLIGGGSGGSVGSAGSAGAWDAGSGYGSPGEGGLPGTPGEGGKIFVTTIQIQPGHTFLASVGKGGAGATTSAAAMPGSATTLGDYTSDDGYPSDTGYANLITGEVYGVPGEEGLAGGSGAGRGDYAGGTVIYKGVTYTAGAKGANDSSAYGGYGGGPAAGSNGGDGQDGEMYRISSGTNAGEKQAQGGNGGSGATPVKAESGKKPGQGGQAGHGGGGGGGGGGASGGSLDPSPGIGGSGGEGGEGGNGADGVILIFF